MTSLHLPHLHRWLLQSPPGEYLASLLRTLLIGALRQGPVPCHIGFVMDGNRRFARKHNVEVVEGHHLGFEALAEILDVCYQTGVRVVTLFAFSIENFKRSAREVSGLMELALSKLAQSTQHGELLERYGIRFNVVGERELLAPEVVAAIDRATEVTKGNDGAILNVCFPYTSREEITHAIRATVSDYSHPLTKTRPAPRSFSEQSITRKIRSRRLSTLGEEQETSNEEEDEQSTRNASSTTLRPPSTALTATSSSSDLSNFNNGDSATIASIPSTPNTSLPQSPERPPTNTNHHQISLQRSEQQTYPDPETITADTLSAHMYTSSCPPLDLLVRTSGVERLSDFMLWQCHEHTSIVFLKCLWPELDLWRFLPTLLEWQWWRMRRERKMSVGYGSGQDVQGIALAGTGKWMKIA